MFRGTGHALAARDTATHHRRRADTTPDFVLPAVAAVTDAWERICRADEVKRGQPLGRVIGDTGDDRDRVCVIDRGNGEYVALLDRCPHEDVALSEGSVSGGDLLCSGHFWTFDLGTGKCVDQPWQRVTRYPTRVVDGWVEAQVPPPAT